jgi:hypothetical protein
VIKKQRRSKEKILKGTDTFIAPPSELKKTQGSTLTAKEMFTKRGWFLLDG